MQELSFGVRKQRKLDELVLKVANDPQILDEFIAQHKPFILRTAARTAKHYVTEMNDEWSIALGAFIEAIKKYDFKKGSFCAFAELVIHRKIVDYYRIQGRYAAEVQVDCIEDGTTADSFDGYDLKSEIEALGQILENYGFNFLDLAKHSPKAETTKISYESVGVKRSKKLK